MRIWLSIFAHPAHCLKRSGRIAGWRIFADAKVMKELECAGRARRERARTAIETGVWQSATKDQVAKSVWTVTQPDASISTAVDSDYACWRRRSPTPLLIVPPC